MNWTRDCDYHVAESGEYGAIISKTYSCPPRRIPTAQRWTLEINGPWYLCRCFPTMTAAKTAAERVIAALYPETPHADT